MPCDLDDLTLYKVPIELYNEIVLYLNEKTTLWPFPKFQKIYDALCEDDVDPKMREFYDKILQCEVIDVDLIQVY